MNDGRRRSVGVCALLALALAGACGGSGATDEDPGTSTGGTSGSGGSANGTPAFTLTEVPDAWVRPAECGGVGDLCPNLAGCQAPTSICQTQGSVCIPGIEEGQGLPSKTNETPYCAAFSCMTFEQASCFCTGPAGEESELCESPAMMAGLCDGPSQTCDADADCCDGLVCLPTRSQYGRKACHRPCSDASECESGCCVDAFDTGTTICAEERECETACKVTGATDCQVADPQNEPSPCCRGTCVESEIPDFAGCRPLCRSDDQCFDGGCCQLFSNSAEGFCVDAQYCGCADVDQPCGADTGIDCCEGNMCLQEVGCQPLCETDADCGGKCCVPVSGTNERICAPDSTCP